MENSLLKTYNLLASTVIDHRKLREVGLNTISEGVYEQLLNCLQALENRHPEWTIADAMGEDRPLTNLYTNQPTLPHVARIWDFRQADEVEELDRYLTHTGRSTYRVEPRYVGHEVELVYAHGNLVWVGARGNGMTGSDVYDIVSQVRGVPLKIPVFDAIRTFHGTVTMPISEFRAVNEQLTNGTMVRVFKNPFSMSSAIFDRTLEGCEDRLDFILEDVPMIDRPQSNLFANDLTATDRLRRAHYLHIGVNKPTPSVDYVEVAAKIEKFEKVIDTEPYTVDGVLLKLDDMLDRQSHQPGPIGRNFRFGAGWGVVWRYGNRNCTTVTDIKFEVAIDGAINTRVEVEPITVMGKERDDLVLGGVGLLQATKIWIGDKILVRRHHGSVDFVFSKRVDEPRAVDASPVEIPEHCPACNSFLLYDSSRGPTLRCCNTFECPGQIAERFYQYLSNTGMGIAIPKVVIPALIRDGHLKAIPDLYELKAEVFDNYKLAKASSEKWIRQIQEALHYLPAAHLGNMGLPGLTLRDANLLMEEMDICRLQEIAVSTGGQAILEDYMSSTNARRFIDFCKVERGSELLVRMGRLLQDTADVSRTAGELARDAEE
jgi:DNA ligase (NAD+)